MGISVLKRRACRSICLFEVTVVEGFQEESHGPVLDLLVPLCVLVSWLDSWH